MKNNNKNRKASLIIALLAIVLAGTNLLYKILTKRDLGSALVTFCSMITIYCGIYEHYKNTH